MISLGESNSGTFVTSVYINFAFSHTSCSFPFVAPQFPPLRSLSLLAILTAMHALYFTLSALLAFATVHAKPQGGTPSGAPTTGYTCPPADLATFPVGTNNSDGTTLFCSYPAFPGEDPNDFFCQYSVVSFQSYPHLFLIELTRFDRLPAQSRKTTMLVSVPAQQSKLVTPVVAQNRK